MLCAKGAVKSFTAGKKDLKESDAWKCVSHRLQGCPFQVCDAGREYLLARGMPVLLRMSYLSDQFVFLQRREAFLQKRLWKVKWWVFIRDTNVPFFIFQFCRRYGAKCGRCGQCLRPNEMVMRTRHFIYHLFCFVCTVCGRSLSTGDRYVIRAGQVRRFNEATECWAVTVAIISASVYGRLRKRIFYGTRFHDAGRTRACRGTSCGSGKFWICFWSPTRSAFRAFFYTPACFKLRCGDLISTGMADDFVVETGGRHQRDGRRGPKRPRTILTAAQRRQFKASFEVSPKPCRKVKKGKVPNFFVDWDTFLKYWLHYNNVRHIMFGIFTGNFLRNRR